MPDGWQENRIGDQHRDAGQIIFQIDTNTR